MASTWTHTETLPDCDLCKQMSQALADPSKVQVCKARVDGRTAHSTAWANMCIGHYRNYGVGLGLGLGQYYVLPGESVPEWVKAYGRGSSKKKVEAKRGGIKYD